MKHLLFLTIGLLFQLNIYSQEIKITASNKNLNKVLLEIRDKYDVDFSFNDLELSKYPINVSKSFKNIDETLAYLFKSIPFEYEYVAGVYVIYPKKIEIKTDPPELKVYRISGRIMELKTSEVLPFSNIIIINTGIISDQNEIFYLVQSATVSSKLKFRTLDI